MIARDHMFETMVVACPSFQPAWLEFCDEWKSEPEAAPLYLALGELAQHLVTQFRSEAVAEFPAVFRVVESWLVDGDEYVREAAVIGLLEGIQSCCGREGIDSKVFEPWLSEELKRAWDELNRLWDG